MLPNTVMSMVFHTTAAGVEDLPEVVLDGVTSPGQAMQPRRSSCFGQNSSAFVEVLECPVWTTEVGWYALVPIIPHHLNSLT